MDKLERDGLVAVVYSPGYGYSWSTMVEDKHKAYMAMSKDIALAVLCGNIAHAVQYAIAHVPGFEIWGTPRLRIEWVVKGTEFAICERDGYEHIEYGPRSYYHRA